MNLAAGDKVWVYAQSLAPFPATVERVHTQAVMIDGFAYFRSTQNRVDGYPGLFRTHEQRREHEHRCDLINQLRRRHVEFKPEFVEAWRTPDLQALLDAVDIIKEHAA